MIKLNKNIKHYILIDEQDSYFSNYIIFEGINEVIDKLQTYADIDDLDTSKYRLCDYLEHYAFDCKVYNGSDWVELIDDELNYICK